MYLSGYPLSNLVFTCEIIEESKTHFSVLPTDAECHDIYYKIVREEKIEIVSKEKDVFNIKKIILQM